MTPHTDLPPIPEATTPEVEAAMRALKQATHVDARKRRRLERELIRVKAESLVDDTTLAKLTQVYGGRNA